MEQLELDINKIAAMAVRKEDQNYRFRSFLKSQDDVKVDKMVQRLHARIASRIDCTLCGNCCKKLSPRVTDNEIQHLAGKENLSTADFESRFIEYDQLADGKFLKDIPCRYLREKKCTVYADRPENCQSYPHLQKPDFTSRTLGVIANYAICPIVYNVYETLKQEMGFR
jgi:hypothetical protein